jgi:hypothetical protein
VAQLSVSPVARLLPEDRTNPAVAPTVVAEDRVRFERALAEVASSRRVQVDREEKVSRRKAVSEAALGDGIIAGLDASTATTAVKGVDAIPAVTAGVVRVSNGTELARALASAKAGQHIVLANGVYTAPGGDFELKASGTLGAPIVIRAENPLAARVTSDIKLSGHDVIASGLVVDRAQVELAGDRARLTGSRIQNHDGIAVLISRGVDTRVDHNELVGLGGRGISIDPIPGKSEALQRPRIDHNWLHDFVGQRASIGTHAPIQIGQCLAQTDCSVQALVEYNLIERVDQAHSIISVKSSDNVIRANTVLDSAGGIVNRHGERNLYEANWIEGSRGMWIRDEDNTAIGNKIVDSGGIGLRVLAGNVDTSGKQKGYPNAVNTHLIGNDVDRLTIGWGYRTAHIAAKDTVIEGSQGAKAQIRMAQGVTQQAQPSIEVPEAVRLTRADVGPAAVGTEVVTKPSTLVTATGKGSSAQKVTTPGDRILYGLGGTSEVEETGPPTNDYVIDPTQLAAMLLAGTKLWNPLLDRT